MFKILYFVNQVVQQVQAQAQQQAAQRITAITVPGNSPQTTSVSCPEKCDLTEETFAYIHVICLVTEFLQISKICSSTVIKF